MISNLYAKLPWQKKDKRLFNSTFALVTQPDEDLTKSMLMFAPDQVCKIENPDARTQKLALKSAYESHVSLSNVYNKIPEPFPDVTEYYQLLSLYENRLDRWYLDEIYESFKHPSEKVTENYKLYKLDCLYRYGDYRGFVGFLSPNLSRKLQEKFQKLFLIAAHERYPHKLKNAYKEANDYPMSDKTNYLYAILTATNLLLESLEPYNYPSNYLGNTIPQILSDLMAAAEQYSVSTNQLFGEKAWLIQEWIKNYKTNKCTGHKNGKNFLQYNRILQTW